MGCPGSKPVQNGYNDNLSYPQQRPMNNAPRGPMFQQPHQQGGVLRPQWQPQQPVVGSGGPFPQQPGSYPPVQRQQISFPLQYQKQFQPQQFQQQQFQPQHFQQQQFPQFPAPQQPYQQQYPPPPQQHNQVPGPGAPPQFPPHQQQQRFVQPQQGTHHPPSVPGPQKNPSPVSTSASSVASPPLNEKQQDDRKGQAFLEVVRVSGMDFSQFCPSARANKDLIKQGILREGPAAILKHVSNDVVKNDPEIVEFALNAASGAATNSVYFEDVSVKEVFRELSSEKKSDPEFILSCIKRERPEEAGNRPGSVLQFVPKSLLSSNRDFVLRAMEIGGGFGGWKFLPKEMQNDAEVHLVATACADPLWSLVDWKAFPLRYSTDRAALMRSWGLIPPEDRKAEFNADKEVVMARCRLFRGSHRVGLRGLNVASDELKNDPEVVLTAVQACPTSLGAASAAMRANRAIVLAAVEANGIAGLKHCAAELRADREIVRAACKSMLGRGFVHRDREGKTTHDTALQHASDVLKNDKPLVLEAVHWHFMAFLHASETLKNDRDVIEAALTAAPALNSGYLLNLTLLPQWAKLDRELVKLAIEHSHYGMALSNSFYADRELVLAALKRPPELVVSKRTGTLVPSWVPFSQWILSGKKGVFEHMLRYDITGGRGEVHPIALFAQDNFPKDSQFLRDREMLHAALHQNPFAFGVWLKKLRFSEKNPLANEIVEKIYPEVARDIEKRCRELDCESPYFRESMPEWMPAALTEGFKYWFGGVDVYVVTPWGQRFMIHPDVGNYVLSQEGHCERTRLTG